MHPVCSMRLLATRDASALSCTKRKKVGDGRARHTPREKKSKRKINNANSQASLGVGSLLLFIVHVSQRHALPAVAVDQITATFCSMPANGAPRQMAGRKRGAHDSFPFSLFFSSKKKKIGQGKRPRRGLLVFCVYTTPEPERRHSQGGKVSGAARCRPTAGGNGQSQKPSRGQTARGQRRLRPRRSREGASRPRAPRALRPRAVAS